MIKAIAFDLWETLITNTAEVSRQQKDLRLANMERILREAGYATAADRIDAAHKTSWRRCHELYWSADRDISCRAQVEHFLEDLELPVSEMPLEALENAYARAAVQILPVAVDGAREVVGELKAAGYSIGLISNTGRTPGYALREILDALGIGPLFDAMIFSNEQGVCKPQRPIFDALREALGVRFNEIAFIGDNLFTDVHGAQQCGMSGIHFVPPKRGMAVAPHFEHGLDIEPHATITDLRQVPDVVESIVKRDTIVT